MEAAASARYALRAGLIHRAVGGEIFVLMADSTVHWLKNASAVALWRTLEAAGADGATGDELAATLGREFEVTAARAAADVADYVSDLVTKGVLVDVTPQGGARGAH